MGQPKFQRKKYETPNHPWQGDRIKAEHELRRKFGLKNKTEIWKAESRLRDIRGQARGLISRTRNPDDVQATKEADLLLHRLHRQGFTGEGATLNEVLGLDVERILNRRLQSQVYLKGMARTMKQARQFVNHGSVRIGDRRITVPSYVVRRAEEELIQFDPSASVADEDHPVRPKAAGAEILETVRDEPAKEAAETAPSAQEEKARTARPDAHPADRNEAPATASEEPNATEIAPEATAEEPKATETTDEPRATETPEAAAETSDEKPKEDSKPEPAKETKETKKADEAAADEAAETETPAESGDENKEAGS